MEIVAVIAVPVFVFLLPIFMVLSYVAPGLFGRDEIWALQAPCLLLLPLSTPLWWITIRRLVFHRHGGFVAPWLVSLLTAAMLVLWWFV
jgi:hypothetical protein